MKPYPHTLEGDDFTTKSSRLRPVVLTTRHIKQEGVVEDRPERVQHDQTVLELAHHDLVHVMILYILNDDDNNNNNSNNNRIQRRYSRFLTISSQRREPSPTRTLKWPGRNRVQTTCNTSSAYHVHVSCYVPLGTKGQLSC